MFNRRGCAGGDVGKNSKEKRPRTQVDGATFTICDVPAATSSKSRKRKSSQEGASTSKAAGITKKQKMNQQGAFTSKAGGVTKGQKMTKPTMNKKV